MIDEMEDTSLNGNVYNIWKDFFTRLLSNSELVLSIKSSQRNDESAFSVESKIKCYYYIQLLNDVRWRHLEMSLYS